MGTDNWFENMFSTDKCGSDGAEALPREYARRFLELLGVQPHPQERPSAGEGDGGDFDDGSVLVQREMESSIGGLGSLGGESCW